ncbi:MAG: hypothetical protein K2N56_05335 [Oscillospiraceae bacterium]|nr:hypothetical protein [Oscillospiraceae bacterium]
MLGLFELLDEAELPVLLDWICGLDDCAGGGVSTVGTCVLSSADELTELDSGIEAGSLGVSAEDGSLVSVGRLSLWILDNDSWIVTELVLDVAELLLVFNDEELLELVL